MNKWMLSVVGIALMGIMAKLPAEDSPSVPKICYMVISAQQECNENYIDWANKHAPTAVPPLMDLRSKWQGMRDNLPDAVHRYGVGEMKKACEGPMRKGAFDQQGKNAATIAAAGGDASRCQKALKTIQ